MRPAFVFSPTRRVTSLPARVSTGVPHVQLMLRDYDAAISF